MNSKKTMRLHERSNESNKKDFIKINRDELLQNLREGDQKPEVKADETVFMEIFDQFYQPLAFGKRLNAKKCLAIDIDADKIRYLLVFKAGSQVQVKKWGVQRFPANETDRMRSLQIALENIRAKLLKQGTSVYVSFFNPDINIRQIVLPKVRKKSDLEKAIFYKNQSDLTNFNKDSRWQYQVLSEFEEEGITKLRILVTVVAGEVVSKYLQVLDKSGLKPEKLLPRPSVLALTYKKMVSKPQRDLLIDISYDFSQVCYLNAGRLEYIRNISVGSANLEVAIHNKEAQSNGKSGGNGAPSPEELKKMVDLQVSSMDDNPNNEIRKRLLKRVMDLKNKQNPVLQMFLGEILRSVEFFQEMENGGAIDRIFLTGYGLKKESVLPYLKNRINIPVFALTPQFEYSEKPSLDFGEFSAALGTALQTRKDFNLVPSEYRVKEKFKQLNMLLITVFFLSAGFAAFQTMEQKNSVAEKQLLLERYQQQYEKLNPVERIYENFINQVESIVAEKRSLLGNIKSAPPLLETMRLFSNEVPDDIQLSSLFFGNYRERNIRSSRRNTQSTPEENRPFFKHQVSVAGVIKSDFLMGDVALINFINHLNDLRYFKNIRLIQKEKDPKLKLLNFELMLFL